MLLMAWMCSIPLYGVLLQQSLLPAHHAHNGTKFDNGHALAINISIHGGSMKSDITGTLGIVSSLQCLILMGISWILVK